MKRNLAKKTKTQRMIHIRLPGTMHKSLRHMAVEEDKSVQQIVFGLIENLLGKRLKRFSK